MNEPQSTLITADLTWKKEKTLTILGGATSPVFTRHILQPGQDRIPNHTLVMIGTLQKTHVVCALDTSFQPINFPEIRSRKSLVMDLGWGIYFHTKLRAYVRQSLFVMKPGSTLAAVPRDPQSHESTFVQWNGSELTLLRDIGLADLVLATSTV
jgi:hypothetical protein